jgi:hypothetical protein
MIGRETAPLRVVLKLRELAALSFAIAVGLAVHKGHLSASCSGVPQFVAVRGSAYPGQHFKPTRALIVVTYLYLIPVTC